MPSESVAPGVNVTFCLVTWCSKAATGATLPIVVTIFVNEWVAPSLSVTVSITACSPALANSCCGFASVLELPSPKSQRWDAIVPSESVAAEVKETTRLFTSKVKSATGATFGSFPPPLRKWSRRSASVSVRE